jgi:hypothetical protein
MGKRRAKHLHASNPKEAKAMCANKFMMRVPKSDEAESDKAPTHAEKLAKSWLKQQHSNEDLQYI